MGKIRSKTLGDDNLEQQEKLDAEKRRAAKKSESLNVKAEEAQVEEKTEKKKVLVKKNDVKIVARSKKYTAAKQLIEKGKLYSTTEALALLEKTHLTKFDETIELHVNTLTTGISGNVTLPHGTGKQTRVAIFAPTKDAAGAENLLKEIESGKISFDILVATPDAMPKLAKVARILGPKGLMPNPKNGTITPKPEDVAKKYEGGQMNFKTEAKSPIIHMVVGKLSFGTDKLSENIQAAITAVQNKNIRNITVKSTMSPAIKLSIK